MNIYLCLCLYAIIYKNEAIVSYNIFCFLYTNTTSKTVLHCKLKIKAKKEKLKNSYLHMTTICIMSFLYPFMYIQQSILFHTTYVAVSKIWKVF